MMHTNSLFTLRSLTLVKESFFEEVIKNNVMMLYYTSKLDRCTK